MVCVLYDKNNQGGGTVLSEVGSKQGAKLLTVADGAGGMASGTSGMPIWFKGKG